MFSFVLFCLSVSLLGDDDDYDVDDDFCEESDEGRLQHFVLTFSSFLSLLINTNTTMNAKNKTDLTRNPIEGFSAGLVDDSNVLQWQVTIMGPPDTLYEGGFFTATMTFPKDYPNKPPDVKFKSEIWHPNVYPDGRVCISILHDAGDDPMGYECASERWSPVQTVETIMLSIISMLSSPNDESPANIDAAKMFREDYAGFKKRVARCVRKSQEECF